MESEATEGRSATQSERPASGFEIDGESYSIPTLDTINLDEERVLYVYSDTVLQDFMPVSPNASDDEKRADEMRQLRIIRNPDFKRALAHIAYRRRHPDLADSEIQEAIGKVNALAVDIAMLSSGDESPPASNSQRSSSSESETSEQSEPSSSGSPTESTSPSPGLSLLPTGTIESDTSSPSHQAIPA